MKAIEFCAKLENGAIKIPDEFQDQIGDQEFHVIILFNKQTSKKISHKKRVLGAAKIKTKGLKFTRDEIYVK